jgi:HAD superfamily hydrolase (TIGR01549 family)
MAGASGRFKVQCVVSDLFNTLVNPDIYRPEGFTRARKIAELLELGETDDFVQWWREMEVQRHVNGSKKVVQYADEYLIGHSGRHCTPDQLDQVSRTWGLMHDQALLKPQTEVLSALGLLRERGVKLGLLSNIDEREAVNWLRSPLSPLFDVVCMSFDTGYSKPSREAYSLILSRLGVDARFSIYMGDGNHNELDGARRAGFGFVVFMKGFLSRGELGNSVVIKSREAQADATIMNLNELVMLVDRLQAVQVPE